MGKKPHKRHKHFVRKIKRSILFYIWQSINMLKQYGHSLS